ncbi:hypothetical protein LSCM4_00898 [Leishmania orientalis]|uniref:OsmC-like protein n=1 Tax=Leishmania orientalis TaxID=2249476 RepID=A0A836G983_9TRYP|nr:hypothetical protein LSCM4_00898 [Leishmania orientalis]
MHRCTRMHYGVFAVFVEELKKVPAYFTYRAREGAKTYVDSASKTMEFLKGEDPNEDPVIRGKRRQHREMYQAILREQAAKEHEKAEQMRANLSWKEKLQLSFKEAKESVAQMTSTKAGVMALLQHCTASHAAEVALEEGIDVKNVQMVVEKAAANRSIGHEEVVVGYIDAPAASREEVMAFAEKLHKACPVASSMHIEWRQGSAAAHSQGKGAARCDDGPPRETERADRGLEWAEGRTSGGTSDPSSSADAALKMNAGSVPAGMPGSRRTYLSMSRRAKQGDGSGRLREGDGELHFPDFKRRDSTRKNASEGERCTEQSSKETFAASHSPSTPPESAPVAATQSESGNTGPTSFLGSPKP